MYAFLSAYIGGLFAASQIDWFSDVIMLWEACMLAASMNLRLWTRKHICLQGSWGSISFALLQYNKSVIPR